MRYLLVRLVIALSTSIEALTRHPLRGLLTGFGILVGVAAVTVVITLGEGAERMVQDRIDRLGENLVTVRGRVAEGSGRSGEKQGQLTEGDARAIAEQVEGAAHVAPVLDGLVHVIAGDRNTSAQAVGSTVAYFGARNYRLDDGSIWDPVQENTAARVVVVGPTVVEELFRDREPVGSSVRIGRYLFRVIGVLEAKGQTPFGMDQDNVIVMPLKTMRSKVSPSRPGEVRQIMVAAAGDTTSDKIQRPITSLLRQRHHLSEDEEDDFSIRDQAEFAKAQRGIVGVMRTLLLSIAGVSLVIGGIGVMNIMLVSVTERSREIGTRLAVGARASDILTQFLIEAVVLALLGGSGGALVALLLVGPLEAYFGWSLSISGTSLVVASSVSIAVGIIFGLLPARRAANMDPVAALRRE